MFLKPASYRFRFILLVAILHFLTFTVQSFAYAQEVVISENGDSSSNEVSIDNTSQTTTQQTNDSSVANNVATSSDTGENTSSGNTGGDTSIITGDASSDVNMQNNLNISSVETNCCSSQENVVVSGNGSDSTNQISVTQISSTDIYVNQNALITNNLKGIASTGGNTASDNSGGSVWITTGDVNVDGRIVNLANNTLIQTSQGFPSDLSVKIKENGSGTENKISLAFSDDVNVYSDSSADIENYVIWDLTTGENSANGDTEGDVSITTGNIDFEFLVKNFLNLSKVRVECCPEEEDGGGPPGQGGQPSEEQGGPSGGDGGGGDGGGGGQILPSAAATEAGGPGIIGLSDTSSGSANALFFFLGLVMISLGGKIATDELFKKTRG